jgi:hypothetical protein
MERKPKPGRGKGRLKGEAPTVVVSMRLTAEQAAVFAQWDGVAWLREVLQRGVEEDARSAQEAGGLPR